jgi:cellulose synthase/poly-beta-1,6-N-acetylglucosamine synthase-like glycosyltransferase
MAHRLHAVILGVLSALLGQALLNRRAIPRLARMPRGARRAAVLIPARNEAGAIAASVEAWARQDHPDYEVIVLDDDSADGTAEIARIAGAPYRHVRVVGGGPLVPGWHGKPFACHRLRACADAEVLVFADADVRPEPQTLTRLVGALDRLPASLVSALPSHAPARPLLWAALGLQNWVALTLAPVWLQAVCRLPLLTATNGQILAIEAAAYDRSGGFASVRGTVAEDAALGRRLVWLGYRVRLVDAAPLAICHAYADLPALWRANVRNLHAVLFGSAALGLAGAAALGALFVVPVLLLAADGLRGRASRSTWLSGAEVALGYLTRALADRRAGYPGRLGLLHPLTVALLAGMLVESSSRAVSRRPVEWRGRHYLVQDDP